MTAERDRTVLILSAGMGAGHDRVAAELASRLAAGGAGARVLDVLDLLPLRLGAALRGGYRWAVGSAPWLYALTYRVFFVSGRTPPASPLTWLLARRLEEVVRRLRPVAVVSTFHVAAQAAGHLRAAGRLAVPSTVVVTDFAAHRLWLHPGNDRYLCPDPATAAAVCAATGRPAYRHAPLVRPDVARVRSDGARSDVARVRSDGARSDGARLDGARSDGVREQLGARPGDRLVLVSAGSWGVGRVEETARVLAATGRHLPVVLCGANDRLRRRIERAGAGLALGWRDDVPALLAAAYALVDNAAGLTCKEAFAAGVPVVSYRPIPGHGGDGAAAMARSGLALYARDAAQLVAALDRLDGTAEREALVARAAALFSAAPAESLVALPPE
ncbi:galactosyldiacylglycerol synthase [Microbispora corallina]|uniref:Diacylglycerol glucosyltransferase N-terminal domain-containing protein n=1 Tax=Microbispora corallina TaxID=83302 RepID=A0ABQ4FZ00_9ACTN|nr:hypothetical protein [Microbispora corallina]GIH40049.1 hypothetical protein Mco01_30490 [Microbispora corallina]